MITPLKDRIIIVSMTTPARLTLEVEDHKDHLHTQVLVLHGHQTTLVPDHQLLILAFSRRHHTQDLKALQAIQAHRDPLEATQGLRVRLVATPGLKVLPVATRDHKVHLVATQDLKVHRETTQVLKVLPVTIQATQVQVVGHKDPREVREALGRTTQARVHPILGLDQVAKVIHQADPVGQALIPQAVGEDQLKSPTENISHLEIKKARIKRLYLITSAAGPLGILHRFLVQIKH